MRIEVTPFKTIDEACAWGREQIDIAAGKARARFITVIAGQDATYQAKYADAQAYVRAGYPEVSQYPWVQKEAEVTGVSAREAADKIKEVGDPWNMVIGPKIEGLRIGGKTHLLTLTSAAAIMAHTRAVQAELNAV